MKMFLLIMIFSCVRAQAALAAEVGFRSPAVEATTASQHALDLRLKNDFPSNFSSAYPNGAIPNPNTVNLSYPNPAIPNPSYPSTDAPNQVYLLNPQIMR
jgi:hypothetical protein